MVGSAFPRRVFSGVEEERTHFEGAIDKIGVGRDRLEKPLEGKIEGERREVGEGEKRVKKTLHIAQVLHSRVLRRTRTLRH